MKTKILIKIPDKNPVVSRYKTSIVSVFIVVMLITLIISIFRYANDLAIFKQQSYKALIEQGERLESELYQPIKAIESLGGFANHYLNYPTELKITLPKLKQEGERYFLEKAHHDILERRPHLSANITCIGDLSKMTKPQKQ